MENRSHALWAGFFTLAMLCATVFAGIWLNRDKAQRTEYQIVTTRPVSGLNPQAAVRYKGLAVGRVDKIEFDPRIAGQIIIAVSIDPDTPITPTTFATLGYQGVTGIAFVQLDDDGDAEHAVRIASVEGKIPQIPLRPGLFERLEQSSKKILASTELVTERMAQMFTPENQKTILSAFSSTAETTTRWRKMVQDLDPTIQALPGLVQQSHKTMASVQSLADNASQLSEQLTGLSRNLQDPNGPLNHALTAVSTLGENFQSDTLPKIAALSTDAGASMRSFNQTMEELKEHPQHLIFGKPAPAPGPGEAGFVEPKK